MNILAVNSSGFSTSIALGTSSAGSSSSSVPGVATQLAGINKGSNVQWQALRLEPNQSTAQFLVPLIQQGLESMNWRLQDLDLLAVTSGPGSFTGLRIGITTVKTLAYAIEKPVVGINSLAAIAQNASQLGLWSNGSIRIAINAFRGQFFIADFRHPHLLVDAQQADDNTLTIDYPQIADDLNSEMIIGGPGIEKIPHDIEERISNRLIHTELNSSAIGVGMLAGQIANQVSGDPFSLAPKYFRGSAAEEKIKSKSNPSSKN